MNHCLTSPAHWVLLVTLSLLSATDSGIVLAETPLHERIDALIEANDKPVADIVDDAGFLRRVCLDFSGVIPTANEVRSFVNDPSPDKRQRTIDKLLNGPNYPVAMSEKFHVVLMERRGNNEQWSEYLQNSFAKNKPFDQIAREILNPDPEDESSRASAFFMTKRLEKYGQNATDFPGLTRDVGRLFLGLDLQCAQCHDHLFIDDYKQVDFQGLFVVFQQLKIRTDVKFPAVTETPLEKRLEFVSVFDSTQKSVGPRIPSGKELPLSEYEDNVSGDEKPSDKDDKALPPSPVGLAFFAGSIPTKDNPLFARNAVNRLWFMMFGRGIVHPLDLHHQANKPSHPELLDMLEQEFVAHNFDIKWLLREFALSSTYQRSDAVKDGNVIPAAETFLMFNERRLSAEQLLANMLQATGELERVKLVPAKNKDDQQKEDQPDNPDVTLDEFRKLFVENFANEPREPEEQVNASVKGALFLMNDPRIANLLVRRPGNLIDRLMKLDSAASISEELYLSLLSRSPTSEEKADVADLLKGNPQAQEMLLINYVWALIASTEFYVQH